MSLAYALLGSVGISVLPLTMMSVYDPNDNHVNSILIALAIGCLQGDAIFHLIPEALDIHSNFYILALILAGMMTFFAFEQYLQLYHCGHLHDIGLEDDNILTDHTTHNHHSNNNASGPLIIASDTMHNLLDGMAIGVSFKTSMSIGLSTTLAVLLHEIPHELSDYAVMGRAGYGRKQILFYSMMASVASLVGACIGYLLPGADVNKALLGFTAGSFLYISMADLVPELLHGHGSVGIFWRNILVVSGALLMLLIKWFFE